MRKTLPLLLLLLAASVATAQEHGPWSLRDCIGYALEHNISLQQQGLQVQQQELQLSTSKGSRLPSVSANASENFSFGRGLTADNTYSNTNTTSTGFSLGASVPVYQGSRISNSIRQDELNLKAVTADFERAKENVSMAVAQAYVQILYNMELLDVARNQVAIDSLQVERLTGMLENGKASPAQVAQQRAALGQSRLTATEALNSLKLAVLDLTQLLELPSPEGFTIIRPVTDLEGTILPDPERIYEVALLEKPAVKAEEFRLDASEYAIKIAKGGYLPTISASGGFGSNYYTMSSAPSNSFADQMKNNFSQYLGLTLSVPIFNGFQTRNQVRAAELSRKNQMLQLENTRKTLYKEIQQAYYNAVAAREKLLSSKEAEASAKESYDLVTAKYENGKANITEFNEARDAFLRSESDLSRARYEFLYATKLLDFYQGRELDF
ncbi:MAG: TolC family protein [Bacteroidales bacterium]|nr:TolC family protein [Bacteroidales bacterium]